MRFKLTPQDELLTILCSMGATSAEKAVPMDVVRRSQIFEGRSVEDELKRLIESGYAVIDGGLIYLTRSGLIRALSRFS